ncbi:hypothetical protein A0H81_13238 [Grifola frondosa]|uniref:Uncharacterized protein n=1 Tax=Grifola frondosa TaxID=5627 RepID=A0A1C7LVK6_GRIFR|nr:hypothetical protein A0H81_13238 [Grifola frondosa]
MVYVDAHAVPFIATAKSRVVDCDIFPPQALRMHMRNFHCASLCNAVLAQITEDRLSFFSTQGVHTPNSGSRLPNVSPPAAKDVATRYIRTFQP